MRISSSVRMLVFFRSFLFNLAGTSDSFMSIQRMRNLQVQPGAGPATAGSGTDKIVRFTQRYAAAF